MSVLDRLPALTTTGVGSLPFADPVAAVRHATRAYGLPFCPQLPRVDGDMVHEWLGAEWSVTPCGWTTERDRERPAAWDAFVATMAGPTVPGGSGEPAAGGPRGSGDRGEPATGGPRGSGDRGEPATGGPVDGLGRAGPPLRRAGARPAHGVAKLQVTGPVTLAVAMERAAGRPGIGGDVARLAHEVAGWLACNVGGQVARLRELGLDVLLLVDEPGLAHAVTGPAGDRSTSSPGASLAATVWDPLRAVASAWGIHVCSAVPWDLVREADPDVVSFDVTRYAVGGLGVEVLAGLVARGGRVAWGVVDPVRPEAVPGVAARVAAGVRAVAAAGAPLDAVVGRSLMTPACGTGRLSPDRERLVASVLDAAAAAVRSTWRAWPHPEVRAGR